MLADFLEMVESRKVANKKRKTVADNPDAEHKEQMPEQKRKQPAGKRLMVQTKAEEQSQPQTALQHEASRGNYRVRNLSDPSVQSVGFKYEVGDEKSREQALLKAQELVQAWGCKLRG